jgi:polysaccharide export outer membrane protein
MRLCRSPVLLLLLAGVALAACARQPSRQQMTQQQYAAHQHYASAQRSDLDTLMYGAPAPRQQQQHQHQQQHQKHHQHAAYRPPQPPPDYRPPGYAPPPPVYRQPAYAPPPAAYRPPRAYYRPPPPPPPRPRYTQYVPMPLPEFDGPYTLDTGDKLRIVVFGQDTLSNTYLVDAASAISMPLIGNVTARDQTTAALAASIKSRLAQGFIREPSVAVEVELYRPFFVLGEVTYPGQYPYVPHMTVENAIAIAGGFTPRAKKSKVAVTRRYQGVPAKFTLPLQYKVRPGDVITVSERWF